MNVRALIFLCLWAPVAWAQGYAGLGTAAEEYAQVTEGRSLEFPADHGPHWGYRIEWWYLTANMTDAAGNPLGLQWTLFRQARAPGATGPEPGWASRQIWMGHAALTTSETHVLSETFARGGTGQAGVETDPFHAFIDDWSMQSEDASIDRLHLTASGDRFSYDVELVAEGPLVLQGEAGFSVKSEQGQASYYYSQPYYRLSGAVTLDGETRTVTGTAWLDREWSSQPLASDQTGWDWFSLTLADGTKLMAFRLNGANTYTSGSWTPPGGPTRPLPNGAMRFTPLAESTVEGRQIPTRWRLEWPKEDLDVTVDALNPNAYMTTVFPYWEGPVTVAGSHEGVGYLEMTGY